MPNIRWVCLSDLHLGEEDSLLTHVNERGEVEPDGVSPVLLRLAECVHELIAANDSSAPRPDLILNGDILELALAHEHVAAEGFMQFLRAVAPDPKTFREIIYLPGNHDHHLWETAREAQYLNYVRRQEPQARLKEPWHTTKVFMDLQGVDRLSSEFLTTLARRWPQFTETEILIAYPNYGVRDPNWNRAVVFHHGHFIEPLYHFMSTVTSFVFPDRALPKTVYALEQENFAWIDFFWSAMGRQGKAGEAVEQIYEATGDETELQKLADELARSLAQHYDALRRVPECTERWLWQKALRELLVRKVTGQQERQRTAQLEANYPLSASARRKLAWYVEELLLQQMCEEVGRTPRALTFVFGHTHKPFQRLQPSVRFPDGVSLFNTGGWVVDSVDSVPVRGAAMVLIDEALHAVNVRLYQEGCYKVSVEEALPPGPAPSAFAEKIRSLVHRDRQPWKSFAEATSREMERRQKLLARRVKGPQW
ncbi:MAG: metallophosphoesterase [Bryobacteraceae bacterium]|nr:metallophosphoesterase [Bryobacteraceae bacterium]